MPLDQIPDHAAASQTPDGPFGAPAQASPLVFFFEGQAPVQELNWVTTVAGQAAAEGQENSVALLSDPGGSVGQIMITNPGGTQVLTGSPNTLTSPGAFLPPPPPVVLAPGQIQQMFDNAISNRPPAPPQPAPQQQTAPGGAPTTPLPPAPQQQGQAQQAPAPPSGPAGGSAGSPDAPHVIYGIPTDPGTGSSLLVIGTGGATTTIDSPPTPAGTPLVLTGSGSLIYSGGLSMSTGPGLITRMTQGQGWFNVVAGAGNDTVVSGGGEVLGPPPSALYGVSGPTGGTSSGSTLPLLSSPAPSQGSPVPGPSYHQPTQTPSWAAGPQAPPQAPTDLDFSGLNQSQYVDLDPQGGTAPRDTAYYEPNSNHGLVGSHTDDPALVKPVAASITTVTGTAMGDVFHGRASADTFHGGGGPDTFLGSLGNDAMHGGAGADSLDYSGLSNDNPVVITGTGDGAGTVDVTAPTHFTQTFTGIEAITGSQGSDTIDLSAWTSGTVVHGGADDDAITGGSGDDTLHGGAGDDTLSGGPGTDSLFGEGGDDILKGSDGAGDTLDGGSGNNAADYSGLSAGLSATFTDPGVATVTKAGGADALTHIGTFTGTGFADTIHGMISTNIFGGGGDDAITGGAVACGGAGADSIDGANDIILYRSAGEGGDTVTNLGSAKFGFLSGQFGGLTTSAQILDGVNFFDANTAHGTVNQAFWYVDGNALMFDADGTTGGQAAVTLATGPGIAGLDAAHVVIVDEGGHQV